MNKLRFHFVIVILCCFSFLLLAGTHVFRKVKVDLDAYEEPTTRVKEHRNHRLVHVKEFKKISSGKNEVSSAENGR
jgi:hypothetical protein